MRPHTGPGHRPVGFSLVEIMIALALGLVIVAALGQVYSGGRQTQVLSDALTRLNENGRFAADFLDRDLRMAGYLSCGGSSAQVGNSVNAVGNWVYDTRGLRGYEGGVDTLPSDFTGEVRTGTDVLIVRRAALDLDRNLLLDDCTRGIMRLGLDHGFQVGEVLVVSDPGCTQVSLFQVTHTLNVDHPGQPDHTDAVQYGTATGAGPGNCTGALFGSFDCSRMNVAETRNFRTGSMVGRYAVHAYYVSAGEPPTLMRKRLTAVGGTATLISEAVVRDVENFQVLYGRDTVADDQVRVDTYVTANLVSDWSAVMSVRFVLLLRSRDDTVRAEAARSTHELLGQTVTVAADRRIRRTFNGLVAVRNQLP